MNHNGNKPGLPFPGPGFLPKDILWAPPPPSNTTSLRYVCPSSGVLHKSLPGSSLDPPVLDVIKPHLCQPSQVHPCVFWGTGG